MKGVDTGMWGALGHGGACTGIWRGMYWDMELHCNMKRGCTKTFGEAVLRKRGAMRLRIFLDVEGSLGL